jgi:ubiquinone/menaquinone biosynthesis C-methylase UbiE
VTPAPSGFDRLARWYRAAEILAFGRDLERARFAYLSRLSACTDVLLLGEGDGRCAERLARLAPAARILCIDSSPGMIARARGRLAGTPADARVQFECADARTFALGGRQFDGVATLFFLDCFGADDVSALVHRIGGCLRPGAVWLFSDFTLPPAGLARLRARVWLRVLYTFFRWETALAVDALPPSEAALVSAGWQCSASRTFQHGLVTGAAYERART